MAIDFRSATSQQLSATKQLSAAQRLSAQYPTYRTAIETTLRSVLSEIRCTGSMSQASLDWVTATAPYLGREKLVEIQGALKASTALAGRGAMSAMGGRVQYTSGGAILNRASLL